MSMNRQSVRSLACAAGAALMVSLSAGAAEIVRYQLNEGAGNKATNSASGTHNGTIVGAVWQTDPVRGVSLDFNPGPPFSYIDIFDNPDSTNANPANLINGANGVTLMAWVKPDAFHPDGENLFDSVIFISSGAGLDRVRAGLYLGGNTEQSGFLRAGGRSGDGQGTSLFAESLETIAAGPSATTPWVHVAGVIDYANDQVRLYINGRQVGSQTVEFPNDPPINQTDSAAAYVGMRPDANERYDGNIDDVRIFNHALTPGEIQAIVPEPASSSMILLGTALLGRRRRR